MKATENSETKNALVVTEFTKKFSKKTIGPFSFEVKQGTFHALIGSSGSGKTVVLKSLVRGISRHKGDISFFSEKNQWKKTKKRIGYVPEFLTFPANTSAYNFIYSLGKLYGLNKYYLSTEIKRLMELFDIWSQHNKDVNTFSSGMKKRVMIIQGIIHNPDIVILDEPDSGLDSDNRIKLFTYLKKLVLMNKTVLICTHMVNEIIPFLDGFTLINQGQQIYSGDSEFIKSRIKFHILLDKVEKFIKFLEIKKFDYELLDKENLIIYTNDYYQFLEVYKFCNRYKIKILYLKQLELTLKEIENLSELKADAKAWAEHTKVDYGTIVLDDGLDEEFSNL